MCFEFYNITSYPGKRCLQVYMNACMAQEVLYCPCKHFTTSRMCNNSPKCNYLEKVDHKKCNLKKTVLRKVNKNGSYLHG